MVMLQLHKPNTDGEELRAEGITSLAVGVAVGAAVVRPVMDWMFPPATTYKDSTVTNSTVNNISGCTIGIACQGDPSPTERPNNDPQASITHTPANP